VARSAPVDLLAELADEDVDRSVAMRRATSPDTLEKLVAREHTALLSRERGVKRVPVEPIELPGLAEALTPAGDIRTLPSMWLERGGLDGFYIARLRA